MNENTVMFCKKLVLGMCLSLLSGFGFAADKQCSAHYIQLFATSVPAKANTMKITLDQAGFNTVISSFQRDGEMLYRVRTGPYRSKTVAVATQQKMKTTLKDNASAQNSIIVTGITACDAVFPKEQKEQQQITIPPGIEWC